MRDMELLSPEEQEHRWEAAKAAVKALVARVPGAQEFLAGWDAYKRSQHDLYVNKLLATLQHEIGDLRAVFSDEWVGTIEGQQFVRKVLDAALDAQLEEKHELFARALVNGVLDKELPAGKKLLFVDLVRRLSLNALVVLAELHKRYAGQVLSSRGPSPTTTGAPQISTEHVIREVCNSEQFHPYMVEQALEEFRSAGLFSMYSMWRFDAHDRQFRPHSHVSPGGASLFYTEFTSEFVRFISSRRELASPSADDTHA